MTDYTELVKALRCQRIGCGDCPMEDMRLIEADHTHQTYAQYCAAHDAADTIEWLSNEIQKLNAYLALYKDCGETALRVAKEARRKQAE